MVLASVAALLGVIFKFVLPIVLPKRAAAAEKHVAIACDAQNQARHMESSLRPIVSQVMGGMENIAARLQNTAEVQRETTGCLKRMEEDNREWRAESRETTARIEERVIASEGRVRDSMHRQGNAMNVALGSIVGRLDKQ